MCQYISGVALALVGTSWHSGNSWHSDHIMYTAIHNIQEIATHSCICIFWQTHSRVLVKP